MCIRDRLTLFSRLSGVVVRTASLIHTSSHLALTHLLHPTLSLANTLPSSSLIPPSSSISFIPSIHLLLGPPLPLLPIPSASQTLLTPLCSSILTRCPYHLNIPFSALPTKPFFQSHLSLTTLFLILSLLLTPQTALNLSLIHISEPTRLLSISYA